MQVHIMLEQVMMDWEGRTELLGSMPVSLVEPMDIILGAASSPTFQAHPQIHIS